MQGCFCTLMKDHKGPSSSSKRSARREHSRGSRQITKTGDAGGCLHSKQLGVHVMRWCVSQTVAARLKICFTYGLSYVSH